MKFSHTTGGRITFKSINVINGIVRLEHKRSEAAPCSCWCYRFHSLLWIPHSYWHRFADMNKNSRNWYFGNFYRMLWVTATFLPLDIQYWIHTARFWSSTLNEQTGKSPQLCKDLMSAAQNIGVWVENIGFKSLTRRHAEPDAARV